MRFRTFAPIPALLIALVLVAATGITSARKTAGPRVAVLTYHHVAIDAAGPYTVTPHRLEQDLLWFLGNGWQPLTIQEFSDWMEGGLSLPKDSFLLTFDDGYASFADHVYPILRRLGIPATVFVITDDMAPPENANGAPKLVPQQIGELARTGRVAFGSHTNDLHHEIGPKEALRPAVFGMEPAGLEQDLRTSVERLERAAGARPVALAWPYGTAPAWAEEIAGEMFSLLFTGTEGFVVQGEAGSIRRFAMEFRTRAHLEAQFGKPGRPPAARPVTNRGPFE